MGQLVIHQKDGILELHGFSLQPGDQVEVFLIDAWILGFVAHDQRGWFLLTTNHTGVRLRTGLAARLLMLSPDQWIMDQEYKPDGVKMHALLQK